MLFCVTFTILCIIHISVVVKTRSYYFVALTIVCAVNIIKFGVLTLYHVSLTPQLDEV